MKKFVLITGVSSGIGLASTKRFIEEGFFTIGSVRKKEDAIRLNEDFPNNFHPLIFDVRNLQAVKKSYTEVEKRTKGEGLLALVNNAGISIPGPLMHVSDDHLRKHLEVNVLGLMNVTRTFLPLLGAKLPKRTHPGRIINISSIAGRIASPFMGPYASSKFALEGLSDVLRRELSIYGIDVITIQAGAIKTPIWEKAIAGKSDFPESDYAPALQKANKFIRKAAEKAIDADIVADYIFKSVTLKKPRTRYIVADKAWRIALIARFMPDRWLDRKLTRHLKKAVLEEQD